MRADLHLHTTFSDGKLTPQQVVKEAWKLNLRAIAITDHDTVDGVPLSLDEAKKYSNLEVIPGIELSTIGVVRKFIFWGIILIMTMSILRLFSQNFSKDEKIG